MVSAFLFYGYMVQTKDIDNHSEASGQWNLTPVWFSMVVVIVKFNIQKMQYVYNDTFVLMHSIIQELQMNSKFLCMQLPRTGFP